MSTRPISKPGPKPGPMYRLALQAYPRDFRNEYSDDLLETVVARESEWASLGFAARQQRRVRELWAIVRGGFGLRGSHHPPNRSPRNGRIMDDLLTDIRHSFRRLTKTPGFTAVAVITLALGIGASTAIFSLVNGILIEPLPFPDADRLVVVWGELPGMGVEKVELSDAMLLTFQGDNSLESMALWGNRSRILTGGEEPVRAGGAEVTPSFFDVLQVQPARGRAFTEAEGGPQGEPVVILSDSLWVSRFGADPEVLGSRIEVSGELREVVGIMPPGFRYPSPDTELWTPFVIDRDALFGHNFSYRGIARMRDGLTQEAAEISLRETVWNLPDVAPGQFDDEMIESAGLAPFLTTLKEDVVGDIGQMLWVMMATVALVLLIASANVANLFLVRAEGSQREVAVRTALGAGRGRVMRFYLTESAALGTLGAVAGLAFAWAAIRVVVALDPGTLPRLEEVSINGSVLGFALGASLLSTLAFGSFPALRLRVENLVGVLKDGGHGATGGRSSNRVRNGLVVAQVALALVLLIASGLMLRSFDRLRDVDPGFDASNAVSMRVSLPEVEYPGEADVSRFVLEVTERIESLPGVVAAGTTSRIGMIGGGDMDGLKIEDFPEPPQGLSFVHPVRVVSPSFFGAMGIPLIEGRLLDHDDNVNGNKVVVVSKAFADNFWPDASPLGKRLMGSNDRVWYSIVGVVGSIREKDLQDELGQTVYLPLQGHSYLRPSLSLVVRTEGNPTALLPAVRDQVWDIDDDLAISAVGTLEQLVADSMARTTFTMAMLGIAAVVSLLLGTVGIYGVIAYIVSQRVPEIGVRMALGAPAAEVSTMVVRQGLTVAALGVALGLAGAAVLTRSMTALLFEVDPLDPMTFVVVPLLLLLAAFVACLLPARRAAGVDPAIALRSE